MLCRAWTSSKAHKAVPTQFDVNALHDLMECIPAGRWVTYGDLAKGAGTIGRALGSHLRSCVECPHAWRVVEEDGVLPAGFRWSDPADTRTQADALRDEGVPVVGAQADPIRRVELAVLQERARNLVAYPTVEYVKEPVDLRGDETGRPIKMRHFERCDHWYREADGTQLLGGPARLASDEQMRILRPCKDCASAAERAGHPVRAVRQPTASDWSLGDDAGAAGILGLPESRWDGDETDSSVMKRIRREQSYLRSKLLNGRTEAPCGLCNRTFPAQLLVAAHIYPRRFLTDAERRDVASAAFLACALGCDALFEWGHIVVDDDGHVLATQTSLESDLDRVVAGLVGLRVGPFNPDTAPNFARHRALHDVGTADRLPGQAG